MISDILSVDNAINLHLLSSTSTRPIEFRTSRHPPSRSSQSSPFPLFSCSFSPMSSRLCFTFSSNRWGTVTTMPPWRVSFVHSIPSRNALTMNIEVSICCLLRCCSWDLSLKDILWSTAFASSLTSSSLSAYSSSSTITRPDSEAIPYCSRTQCTRSFVFDRIFRQYQYL